MHIKRRFGVIIASAAIALGLFAAAPASAVVDNGTGHFWLFQGLNGTGQYRDYNIGPSQVYSFIGVRFNINCGGSCVPMQNNVESVKFSCGITGAAIDQNDTLTFYDQYPNIGAHQLLDPNYPASCVNGTILMNLSTLRNLADSVITHE